MQTQQPQQPAAMRMNVSGFVAGHWLQPFGKVGQFDAPTFFFFSASMADFSLHS
jgi:hypothetical protein